MRYLTLAADYDGTLAHDGAVDQPTLQGLECLIHSGRKLILVTGRELPDLQSVFRLELEQPGASLSGSAEKLSDQVGPSRFTAAGLRAARRRRGIQNSTHRDPS